jgi:hypothetical protein
MARLSLIGVGGWGVFVCHAFVSKPSPFKPKGKAKNIETGSERVAASYPISFQARVDATTHRNTGDDRTNADIHGRLLMPTTQRQ